MMTEYYRDPYGCTASISKTSVGKYQLRICIPSGSCFFSKVYSTWRGARIALGKHSDGMMEMTKRKEN